MATTMDDLRTAGLLEGIDAPHLTIKGRDWLRLLEEMQTQAISGDDPDDFVLSTNGLYR